MSRSNEVVYVADFNEQRRLSYGISGDLQSNQMLICIPGILETRQSFTPLISFTDGYSSCVVVTVDLCGRGQSDPLRGSQSYAMSVYLNDLTQLLSHLSNIYPKAMNNIHLLGTSMGGILAMYLIAHSAFKIKGLMLNDIGLTLPWMSIYSLYGQISKKEMKGHAILSKILKVDSKLLADVQKQSHFDLPYKRDLMGMRFSNLLQNFKGEILLLYGENSKLCTYLQVNELSAIFPTSQLIRIENEGHPVSFSPIVCSCIATQLKLKKISLHAVDTSQDIDHLMESSNTIQVEHSQSTSKLPDMRMGSGIRQFWNSFRSKE
jgi:pimeloyl-ACP methyl ester carboxylesterase